MRVSARATVFVMKPAAMRDGVDGAVAVFDGARFRRVAMQRHVEARRVVVLDVRAQHAPHMLLPPRDDVVRALTPDAADDALGGGAPDAAIRPYLPFTYTFSRFTYG